MTLGHRFRAIREKNTSLRGISKNGAGYFGAISHVLRMDIRYRAYQLSIS